MRGFVIWLEPTTRRSTKKPRAGCVLTSICDLAEQLAVCLAESRIFWCRGLSRPSGMPHVRPCPADHSRLQGGPGLWFLKNHRSASEPQKHRRAGRGTPRASPRSHVPCACSDRSTRRGTGGSTTSVLHGALRRRARSPRTAHTRRRPPSCKVTHRAASAKPAFLAFPLFAVGLFVPSLNTLNKWWPLFSCGQGYRSRRGRLAFVVICICIVV